MVRLRRAAMISGPLRVRSWWRSSSKTTSRTDVETVLDALAPADPGRDGLGLGVGHGQGARQVDHLDRLPGFWRFGCVGPGPPGWRRGSPPT